MTPDLAELRALADAATDGEWERGTERLDTVIVPGRSMGSQDLDEWYGGLVIGESMGGVDAEFIAAARSAVPALCDEVDRLRGLLDCCESALEGMIEWGHSAVVSDGPLTSATGGSQRPARCATCGYVWPCRYARARAVLAELRAAKGDSE